MPHNARLMPAGWAPGTVVTAAMMNYWDTLIFQSINGDLGGVWSPFGRITIGGAGVTFDSTGGNLLVTGSGVVNLFSNAVTVSSTVANFYGGAFVVDPAAGISIATPTVDFGASTLVTFNNGLDVATGNIDVDTGGIGITAGHLILAAGNITLTAGNIDVTTGTLHVGGNVQFDANLSAAGTVTLGNTLANTLSVQAGLVVVNGTNLTSLIPVVLSGGSANLSVGGTSAFTGAITIGAAAAVSLASIVTPTGIGRVRKRPPVALPDADHTIAIADGDVFLMPALGAARTYPISTTGAGDGDEIEVAGFANTTANYGNVNGVWFLRKFAAGDVASIRFIFGGGVWNAISETTLP